MTTSRKPHSKRQSRNEKIATLHEFRGLAIIVIKRQEAELAAAQNTINERDQEIELLRKKSDALVSHGVQLGLMSFDNEQKIEELEQRITELNALVASLALEKMRRDEQKQS